MSRKKRILFFPKTVTKMMYLLQLITDRHEVGYAVLMGYDEWPNAEELERVPDEERTGFASAEDIASFIDAHGGHEKIIEAVRKYGAAHPCSMKLLKEIATKNVTRRSLDEIAADNFIDAKTLKARKEQILHDIAFQIIYGDKLEE